MISDAFSFKPNWEAIWIDPCCINTKNADTKIMANGLNLDIHATMIAVNPRPPGCTCRNRMACTADDQTAGKTTDCTGNHHGTDDYFFTLMPA